MSSLPIRVVCATRLPREKFLTTTATGKTIRAFIETSPAEVRLYASNTTGLGELYNMAIEESINKPAILVFIHDDILISDFFWSERIKSGLEIFDIVGLAGNKRRVPGQPSWAFVNDKFEWDERRNLSGAVGHGDSFPPQAITPFGLLNQECKLLDGLLLAVNSRTLLSSGLRFDERFKFHFYDLDFCRSAEQLNLRMGTIALSVLHESGGNFSSDAWVNGYKKYLDKWKE